MATFILSYDLRKTTPDPHAKFIEAAVKNGWMPWILSGDNVWYQLPNTTLVGDFATEQDAVRALESTRSATQAQIGGQVILEKWIIAQYASARFDSDVKQPKR